MPAPDRTDRLIRNGLYLAGAYNIVGVLSFSQLFSNPLLALNDPTVFAWPGLLAILLWGAAYAAVAQVHRHVPVLLLVFFAEKMLYVTTWLLWLSQHASGLPALWTQSPLTALFFAVYGGGDLVFGLFFLWVALRTLRQPRSST